MSSQRKTLHRPKLNGKTREEMVMKVVVVVVAVVAVIAMVKAMLMAMMAWLSRCW